MIVEQARFNGTVFMTVVAFNAKPAAERHNNKGQCYAKHNGKWCKVGFVKPKEQPLPVKAAA